MGKIQHIPCSIVKVPQVKTFSQSKESGNLEKVKIVVMHSGLNGNNSDIPDEAVEEAKDTISNIPILAYIKRDDDGEAIDFDQHNVITKIVQGDNGHEVEQFYLERPIGVIPETHNYRIEEIDGVNHVVVDGYVWKTYSNEGYDIITESGEKGVSMEISVEDGSKDKKTGVYTINKYSYLGVTVLGDDVTPAMGSTCKLETYSSNEEFQFAMEELNKEIQKYQKEVEAMENTQTQDTVVDTTQVEEQETTECQEPEKNFAQESEDTEPTQTEGGEGTECQEPEQQNFSLSIENMSTSIRNTLYGRKCKKKYSWGEEYETQEFYLRTIIPSTNTAILEDNSSSNYTHYGVPFSLQGDDVVLDFDNKVEYIQTWRAKENGEQVITFSERQEDDNKIVNSKFSAMETEITELKGQVETKDAEIEKLKAFKLEKDQEALTQEVNNVVAQFSTSLEEDEYKEVRDKALSGEITVDTLKFNLYALKGMKQEALEKEQQENFSQKGSKETEPVKVVVTSNIIEPTNFSANSRYGSLSAELARISAQK